MKKKKRQERYEKEAAEGNDVKRDKEKLQSKRKENIMIKETEML